MTGAFNLQEIAQLYAPWIVDSLVGGTLIAACAALMSFLWPGRSSARRFSLWFSALIAIAVLPLLGFMTWSREPATAPEVGKAALTLPAAWAIYLFAAWGVVAAALVARICVGLWRMRNLRKNCKPLQSAEVEVRLRATVLASPAGRPVLLWSSDRVQVPTAIGLFSPAVIFPSWAVEELAEEDLDQILRHELAHLRRWDDWTNLLQKVVKALFFFHPAVWWIEGKLSLERELACDDAVLSQTGKPRAYAECLIHLAERTFARKGLALAQAMLGRVRQTSRRVEQILDAKQLRDGTHGWKVTSPLMAGLAVACVLLVSREPRLLAFQDVRPNRASPSLTATVNPQLRPIAAAFRPETAPAPTTLVRRKAPRSPNSNGAPGSRPTADRPQERHSASKDLSAQQPPIAFTRFSNATVVVPTETILLLVEDPVAGVSGPTIYEIHLWRWTVFHPPARSIRANPQSQT